jgi:hypothetical protein
MGKVPLVLDGDVAVAETGAISPTLPTNTRPAAWRRATISRSAPITCAGCSLEPA